MMKAKIAALAAVAILATGCAHRKAVVVAETHHHVATPVVVKEVQVVATPAPTTMTVKKVRE